MLHPLEMYSLQLENTTFPVFSLIVFVVVDISLFSMCSGDPVGRIRAGRRLHEFSLCRSDL